VSVAYNVPITFGRAGSVKGLNPQGIDFLDEGERSWTSSPLAEFDVRLPLARDDVAMEVLAAPFKVDTAVPHQQLFVYLGGMFVGFWIVTEYGRLTTRVNRALLNGRPARVSFAIPTARSPLSLGLSEDKRELGVHLHQVVFRISQ
jgi:hypothetical protein